MNGDSANKFISALVKSLQTLCHGYVEFNDGIEIIGHLYLNIDSGASFDYVVKEKVCKNAENSTVFVSKSFQAQAPAEECITRKDKDDEAVPVFEESSEMSPTTGTSRLQSAITSISNVLSGSQHDVHKSRMLDHSSHHSPVQNNGKRKREHNGSYSGLQPPYKYTTLQATPSTYFNTPSSSTKQVVDRNHSSEHFNNSSHAEFFGGDSNQSSGMGREDEDDLDLDVTFVKEEYESQRNSGQRGVSAGGASRLSQDPSSNQSNILHDGGTLGYQSTNHHQAPQQFASGTAVELGTSSQNFTDPSQVDLSQHSSQSSQNPRTLLAFPSRTLNNRHMSPSSPSAPVFDMTVSPRLSLQNSPKARGQELLHTQRQTKWAIARAREWLALHGMNINFEQFTDEQLDQMFLGFYTSSQKKDGSPFSATALLAFRTAISRYLNTKCARQTSIAVSHTFKNSNAVLARLMATAVKVNKTISVQDIILMYTTGTLSCANPEALLYKVWFELQMHFRSKVDWSKVLVDHFFFSRNQSGKITVTWNTCGLGNCNQVTIFEATGGPYCPVESLRLYLEHRNNTVKVLLQIPASKDLLDKGIWYLPEEIRDYREKSFMKKISSQAKLSQTYTNACVLNSFEDYFQAMLNLNQGKT
uniref:DUF3504 domain-containing protein n=1 Tax=Biomphalaria glabrata TaxID=6526 RepID=A0A2C9LI36_BIOGL